MLKIEYSPERVAFCSQTECGICMDSYQEKDRIVELACKHIYHEDCVPESMVRCPKCRFAIAGRAQNYTREDTDRVIDEIMGIAMELFPSLKNASEQSAKMIQQAVAGFKEGYYEQISQTVIRTSMIHYTIKRS